MLIGLIAPKTENPFRPEEVSCALELLEAVLDPPEGNTYEALVLVGGAPMTIGRWPTHAMAGCLVAEQRDLLVLRHLEDLHEHPGISGEMLSIASKALGS